LKTLDLSEGALFELKLKSGSYKIRDLTKKEIEAYDDAVKVNPLAAFDTLLKTVGIPESEIDALGVAAKNKIMEAIFDALSFKKKLE
jgi:hypothetical protein